MKNMKQNWLALLFLTLDLLLALLIVVNGYRQTSADEPDPTPTVVITATSTPTQVPTPTFTVTPTFTPTPSPSPTPVPTSTPSPTPSPVVMKGQTKFKSYMSYKAITLTSSDQYKLQQIAYTGDYGLRMVDDRYCVALGSRWAKKIGTKLDVYLDDGTVLKVILGDQKQDRHTDSTNSFGLHNGDVLEFIVDMGSLPDMVKAYGSFHVIFGGLVVRMEVVE